jgi:hypothetical protein
LRFYDGATSLLALFCLCTMGGNVVFSLFCVFTMGARRVWRFLVPFYSFSSSGGPKNSLFTPFYSFSSRGSPKSSWPRGTSPTFF